MRDRRSVDDLSIEELEQILRIKKREARKARLQRFEIQGRRMDIPMTDEEESEPEPEQEGISFESIVHTRRIGGRRKRTRRDRLLLLVEIGAVLSIAAVLIIAAFNLQTINQIARQNQEEQLSLLPTPSPTPLFSLVVLPGGHTFDAQGEPEPNYDEVPAQFRPDVLQQYAGPAVEPTSSPNHAYRIRIPGIEVDAPIVQGDGWEQLRKGVGQHIGSASPGDTGNVVLSAHNDIFGQYFRYLDQLSPGDEIVLETQHQNFTYEVLYWRIVSPTDVSVMDQTAEPIVTLISCYPYLVNNERIVVIAERKQ